VDEDFEAAWGWTGPAGEIRAQRRADFLIEAARLAPGVSCLELGAGTGQFTARLAESRCDLTAVEISEATAGVCRERVDGRAQVVVGNIETAEGIAGRTFDAIVGVSVLHHVDLDLTIRNTLLPLLRPGGRFAFSEPNMANPQVWAERNIRPIGRMRHTTEHETAFRAGALRATLERAGLSVDVCEPFEFLHPSTPRALISLVERLERRLEASPARAIAGSVRVAGSR
jgi:SAM-dependent methyltransferase